MNNFDHEGRIQRLEALLRLASGGGGGPGFPVPDNVFAVVNAVDPTKVLVTDESGQAPGTTTTLHTTGTIARDFRLPNISGTAVVQEDTTGFVFLGPAPFPAQPSNARVQLSSLIANGAQFRANQYGANNAGPGVAGFKSRGVTVGALGGVIAGDLLWRMTCIGVAPDNVSVPLAGTISVQVPAGFVSAGQNYVPSEFEVALVSLAGPINSRRSVLVSTSEGETQTLRGLRAGGRATLPTSLTTGAFWSSGNSDPNGIVVGNRGDLYSRQDGAIGTSVYIKGANDGLNTGWTPVGAGAVLTVANVAALIAFGAGLTDGSLAWVQTLRTYFAFESSAASLTIDGITVEATSVGGASRWVRTQHADAVWRIGHDNWYVDPAVGNDENDGATALTALQTFAELARRWGNGPLVQTTDPNLCINLFVLSDVAPPDQLVIRPIFGPDTALRIFGGVSATIRVGTVTAFASQIPGLNTSAQIADAAFGGVWELGERLRITSPGAAFNACCQLQNDLGGGVVEVSVPAYADESTFVTVPTALFPSVGDAYAVERLRTVPIGFTKAQPSVWPTGFLPVIDMVDCNLVPVSGFTNFQNLNYIEGEGANDFSLILYQCTIDIAPSMRGVIAVNSFFRVDEIELRQTAQINGGGAWVPAGVPAFILFSAHDGFSTLDYNFQSWGVAFAAASPGSCGSFAVFNASPSFINPGGHGVRVGNASAFEPPTKFRFRGQVWGQGNTGMGLHVAATSSVEHGPQPTITGGTGDFSLYLPATARAWDEALGLYTVPIACSWAAYGTPVAIGGFGQNAHQLYSDTHLVVNIAP